MGKDMVHVPLLQFADDTEEEMLENLRKTCQQKLRSTGTCVCPWGQEVSSSNPNIQFVLKKDLPKTLELFDSFQTIIQQAKLLTALSQLYLLFYRIINL